MSDTVENVEVPVVEVAEATEQTAPRVLKIHGKEFDVSTNEGMIHAQAWGEAISSLVGRQANEVGELRKFASARKPSTTEAELIADAKKRAAEGDVEGAIERMFSYAKETESKSQEALRLETSRSETWDSYFDSRPELTKLFDRKTVKKVSESALDIYNIEGDAFAALDAFWKPKSSALSTVQPAATESQTKKIVPPATLSGGTPRGTVSAKPVAANTTAPSWEDVLSGASLSEKVKKSK